MYSRTRSLNDITNDNGMRFIAMTAAHDMVIAALTSKTSVFNKHTWT